MNDLCLIKALVCNMAEGAFDKSGCSRKNLGDEFDASEYWTWFSYLVIASGCCTNILCTAGIGVCSVNLQCFFFPFSFYFLVILMANVAGSQLAMEVVQYI